MAMPWSKAKAKAKAIRADVTGAEVERLNRLFKSCFRLQKEASEAAGKPIPLVVENVRGAQDWVGRSRWNHGSFHLWGDVPALMPMSFRAIKVPSIEGRRTDVGAGARFTSRDCGRDVGIKQGGDWFNASQPSMSRLYGSKSPQRKMASAMIAKIPLPLSRHIAKVFHPS